MKLKRLTLTNFRIFEQATFDFQPGMNLIVGINGAGKSSALDALRILLSRSLRNFTVFRSRGDSFNTDDITIGRNDLTTELLFESSDLSFSQLIRQQREEHIPVKKQEGQVRGQTYDREEADRFSVSGGSLPKDIRTAAEQPLALYFSTFRSFPTMRVPSRLSSTGDQKSAFVDALSRRQLRLREFADWWLAQKALSQELADPIAKHRLEILANAVQQFLEGYTNLRAVRIQRQPPRRRDRSSIYLRVARDPLLPSISGGSKLDDGQQSTLLLDKNSATLDVRQLSDGERGMLALRVRPSTSPVPGKSEAR